MNFFEGDFMPHGHCYFWRPDILWSNVLGDALTSLSYFSIPILLVYFLKNRPDIKFRGIFYLFALFILSCGITRVLTIVSVWEPIYALEGIAKIFTGLVSASTAVVLFIKIPFALKIPSPEKLEAVNNELKEEIRQRSDIEKQLLSKAFALESSNSFLKELTYSTSHDLKEPGRNITLMAQRFYKKHSEKFDAQEQENLKIMVDEGKRMIDTIESLETADKMDEVKDPMLAVPLSGCLDNAIAALGNSKEAASIELKNDLPTWVCYPALVTELFKQILSNSIKFKKEETIQITISSSVKDDVLSIEISDNGIGFNPKYAERIFRMFERLENRSEYPGAGLGLSTCKKIIEIHKGTISAKSTEGNGAKFTLQFPKPD